MNRETVDLRDDLDLKTHFRKSGDSLIIKADPPRFTVLAASERFLASLTLDEAEVIGKGVFEVFPDNPGNPTGAERARQTLMEVIESKRSIELPVNRYAALAQKGNYEETFWSVLNTPVLNQDGQIEYIINTSRNITESVLLGQKVEVITHELEQQRKLSKERESEVQKAKDNLSLVLESARLGFYELDIASGTINCTDQYKANLGLKPDAPVDRTILFRSMSDNSRDPAYNKMVEAIRNKTTCTFEYEVKWPDGSVHWIRSFGKPKYNADGDPLSLTGATLLITSEKQMEQQKDDLLGIASHEFKTPVTSLKASLQLLSRIMKVEQTSEKASELVGQAQNSLKKLGNLVDDLLNISKVHKGKIELEKTEFTLSKVIEECCNHIKTTGVYNIIITGDFNLRVYADSLRIDQVVVNLVNNAIKHAPNSKDVIIDIERIENTAKVSVTDKGPGIPPQQQAQIFKRYYQTKGNSSLDSGLGLGLYISAEIINQHQGKMGVESEVGKGSTFWFMIPLQ